MSTPILGSLAAAFAKSADWLPGVKPPGPVNNLTQPILPNAQPAPQGAAAVAPTQPNPATPTAKTPPADPTKIAPQQPQPAAKPGGPTGPAAPGGLAAAYSPQAWAASQGYRVGEVKPAPSMEPYVAPTTYNEYGGPGGPVQRPGTRVVMPQAGAEVKAGPDDGRDAAVTKPPMSRERMYSQLGIPGGFIPPAAPSVYVSPDIDVNAAPKPTPSTGGSYGRVAPAYDPDAIVASGLAQSYATDAATRDSSNQLWDEGLGGQAWNWATKHRGDLTLHNRYDPIRGGFAKEEDVPKVPFSYLDAGLVGAPALAAGGKALGKAVPSLFPRSGVESARLAEQIIAAEARGATAEAAALKAQLEALKTPPTPSASAPKPAAPATPKPVESAPPVVEDYPFDLGDLRRSPKPPPTSGKTPGVPLNPKPAPANPARAGAASDLPVKPPIPKPGQPVAPKPAEPAAPPASTKGMPTTNQPKGFGDDFTPAGVFDTTPVAKSPKAVEPPAAAKAKPVEPPAAGPAGNLADKLPAPSAPKTAPPRRTGDDAFNTMQGGDHAKAVQEWGAARARNAPADEIAALKAKMDAIKNRSAAPAAPKPAEPPAAPSYDPAPIPGPKAPPPEPTGPAGNLAEKLPAPKAEPSAPKPADPFAVEGPPVSVPMAPRSTSIAGPEGSSLTDAAGASPKTAPPVKPTPEPALPSTAKPVESDLPWAQELDDADAAAPKPTTAGRPAAGAADEVAETAGPTAPKPPSDAPGAPPPGGTPTPKPPAGEVPATPNAPGWKARHPLWYYGLGVPAQAVTGAGALRHGLMAWKNLAGVLGRNPGSAKALANNLSKGWMYGEAARSSNEGVNEVLNPGETAGERTDRLNNSRAQFYGSGSSSVPGGEKEINPLVRPLTYPLMFANPVLRGIGNLTGQGDPAEHGPQFMSRTPDIGDYLMHGVENPYRLGKKMVESTPSTLGRFIRGTEESMSELIDPLKPKGQGNTAKVNEINSRYHALRKEYAARVADPDTGFAARVAAGPEYTRKLEALRDEMSQIPTPSSSHDPRREYARASYLGGEARQRLTAEIENDQTLSPEEKAERLDVIERSRTEADKQQLMGLLQSPEAGPLPFHRGGDTTRVAERYGRQPGPDVRILKVPGLANLPGGEALMRSVPGGRLLGGIGLPTASGREDASRLLDKELEPHLTEQRKALEQGLAGNTMQSDYLADHVASGMTRQELVDQMVNTPPKAVLDRAAVKGLIGGSSANILDSARGNAWSQALANQTPSVAQGPVPPVEPIGRELADVLGEDAKSLYEAHGDRALPRAHGLATESVAGNMNAWRLAMASGMTPGVGGIMGNLATNAPETPRQANPAASSVAPFGISDTPEQPPYIFRRSESPAQGATPAAQPWLGAMAPETPWAEGSPHAVAAAGLNGQGGIEPGAATWKGEDGKPAPGNGVIPNNEQMPPDKLKEGQATAAALAASLAGLAGAQTSEAAQKVLDATEPPPGFKGYWSRLPSTSKILAIAGVSLAGISLLRSMFGSGKKKDDEEEDEGFLMKALPFIGIGAAAWGIGGGTFSSLPEMKHYNRFIGGVTSNMGSLADQFTGSKKPDAPPAK